MSNTRRSFLHSGAALAAGLTGASATLAAQQAAPPQSAIQVPKMKFGGAEISRMVLGVNPFYGFAHYNNNFSVVMKEWYTGDKVCAIMHQCNRYGINAFNYVHLDRAPQDLARFRAEGGNMYLIVQVSAGVEASMLVKTLKPLALHRQGEVVDKAYQSGQMQTVKEWCKQVRDLGVLVGVGTPARSLPAFEGLPPPDPPQADGEGMVQAGARSGGAGGGRHSQAGSDRAGRGGGLGRGFLRRLRLQPDADQRRVEEGAQRRDRGNVQRDLSAKRSAAHVPGDAAKPEAVLRVQDPGCGTDPRS